MYFLTQSSQLICGEVLFLFQSLMVKIKPGTVIQQLESWGAMTFGPRTPLHLSLLVINRLCLVTQPCLTLCNPLDYSPRSYPVHGLFQARILEWVAISSFRGSSWPRDQTHISCVSCFTGGFFTSESLRKPRIKTWMTVICVNFQHLSWTEK